MIGNEVIHTVISTLVHRVQSFKEKDASEVVIREWLEQWSRTTKQLALVRDVTLIFQHVQLLNLSLYALKPTLVSLSSNPPKNLGEDLLLLLHILSISSFDFIFVWFL